MDLVAVLVSAAPAELLKINRVVVENVADEAAAAARGKGAEPAVAAACALTPIVDDLLYMVPEGSVSLGAALTGSFVLDIPHPSGRTLRWSPPPGTPVQTGDVWLIAGGEEDGRSCNGQLMAVWGVSACAAHDRLRHPCRAVPPS
jgi:hypothetical protein